MADFKLTPEGDLDVSNGLQIVTNIEEKKQRLLLGWSINLGEFFTHKNYGLPYLKSNEYSQPTDVQYFLDNPDITAQYIVKSLDEFTESIEFVKSFSSTYDYKSSTRELYWYPVIVTDEDDEIVFPPYVVEV
ncbi:hypothetical protein NVP1161O_066 [Vibrio phage 1.161.O._10N.261.48.C5]|nr:hypothetical protein NVP1161O_066 [Vibrio phage 1.161.O._10N.261.48.C5]